MERAQAEAIVEALSREGYDASLYEGYSGRGMFGKESTGVNLLDFTHTLRAVALCPSLAECRRDSLGHGVIFY